jgi:hypothetical protein
MRMLPLSLLPYAVLAVVPFAANVLALTWLPYVTLAMSAIATVHSWVGDWAKDAAVATPATDAKAAKVPKASTAQRIAQWLSYAHWTAWSLGIALLLYIAAKLGILAFVMSTALLPPWHWTWFDGLSRLVAVLGLARRVPWRQVVRITHSCREQMAAAWRRLRQQPPLSPPQPTGATETLQPNVPASQSPAPPPASVCVCQDDMQALREQQMAIRLELQGLRDEWRSFQEQQQRRLPFAVSPTKNMLRMSPMRLRSALPRRM